MQCTIANTDQENIREMPKEDRGHTKEIQLRDVGGMQTISMVILFNMTESKSQASPFNND